MNASAFAVPDGQHTFGEVSGATADEDGRREAPGADARDPGEQHEDLERGGRRQDRWDEHGHDPITPERRHRFVHARRVEALSNERVAAFPAERVQQQTPGSRPERRGDDVDDEAPLVLGHHPDDEEIRDLGQREKRGIQECDEEESRGAERKRHRLHPADDSTHRINR